jgi:hypothetical protein
MIVSTYEVKIMKKKSLFIGYAVFLLVVVLLISFLSNFDLMKMDPLTTGEEFLASMPYIMIGSLLITQPSSSIFIFALSILIIIFGIHFLRDSQKSEARKFWGFGMIFWGVASLFAGISYQAFGYELKCLGNEYANWTDWFEIIYYLFMGTSICLLIFSMSYALVDGKTRKIMQWIALVCLPIYAILLVVGSIAGIKFLVSYELLCIFFMWHFIVFFVLNIKRYRKYHTEMDKQFIIAWSIFLLCNVIYYIYYLSGVSEVLYANFNIWFNQNDVLHVLMLGMFIYMYVTLPKLLTDYETQSLKN